MLTDYCRTEEEEKLLVGWPPIQTWRKKLLHQGQIGRIEKNNRMANQKENNNYNGGLSNSKFVKVKMEGVAIGRKVDLRLYYSFETLINSLIAMFAKCKYIYTLNFMHGFSQFSPDRLTRFTGFYFLPLTDQKCEKPGLQFTLTYQDKEGDWLLARDVPWQ